MNTLWWTDQVSENLEKPLPTTHSDLSALIKRDTQPGVIFGVEGGQDPKPVSTRVANCVGVRGRKGDSPGGRGEPGRTHCLFTCLTWYHLIMLESLLTPEEIIHSNPALLTPQPEAFTSLRPAETAFYSQQQLLATFQCDTRVFH